MDQVGLIQQLVAVNEAQDALVDNHTTQLDLLKQLMDSNRELIGILEKRVRNLEDYLELGGT